MPARRRRPRRRRAWLDARRGHGSKEPHGCIPCLRAAAALAAGAHGSMLEEAMRVRSHMAACHACAREMRALTRYCGLR